MTAHPLTEASLPGDCHALGDTIWFCVETRLPSLTGLHLIMSTYGGHGSLDTVSSNVFGYVTVWSSR